MLEEPWITFLLIIVGMTALVGAVFMQDRMSDRAAARRHGHDAASHPAE